MREWWLAPPGRTCVVPPWLLLLKRAQLDCAVAVDVGQGTPRNFFPIFASGRPEGQKKGDPSQWFRGLAPFLADVHEVFQELLGYYWKIRHKFALQGEKIGGLMWPYG